MFATISLLEAIIIPLAQRQFFPIGSVFKRRGDFA
jgi:hypothetical protein